jgi:hypothetical protein
MKGTEYFVIIKFAVLTKEHNVMVNSEELIGAQKPRC